MATPTRPIAAQLGKLFIGGTLGPRTSIRTAKKYAGKTQFPMAHGEKIYVFQHLMDRMTVYSHDPVLKATNALRQIPFKGKKFKPSKIRKDYWRPLALIQFDEGRGDVGRSVYQRLRECKTLHDYSWDDSVLVGENRQTLTRRERGRKLNDQRANTIADIAAVLGGLGKGNKMWLDEESSVAAAAAAAEAEINGLENESEGEGEGLSAAEKREKEVDAIVRQNTPPVTTEGEKTLCPVTVFWTENHDRYYAKKWTKNVTHALFQDAVLEPRASYLQDIKEDGEGEGGEASQTAPAEIVAGQELPTDSAGQQSQRL
ncbi:hypothetical protein F4777DRAFT_364627 [Nemania sp. FL0916]|nr:hypothetical protein F4777DRAFT_364627 [Nemania sp. FL0916]